MAKTKKSTTDPVLPPGQAPAPIPDPSGLLPLTAAAPSAAPQPKVLAAGAAGAITSLIIWGLTSAGVEVTAEVASAFTTLIAFVAGYFTSNK